MKAIPKRLKMDFCPKDPGFSGLNTLQSELVEWEGTPYGTRYAIVDQSGREENPYQVILMDSEFDPLDNADFGTFHEVEKWLIRRGVILERDDDVDAFLNA
jgi:hypothetical protein